MKTRTTARCSRMRTHTHTRTNARTRVPVGTHTHTHTHTHSLTHTHTHCERTHTSACARPHLWRVGVQPPGAVAQAHVVAARAQVLQRDARRHHVLPPKVGHDLLSSVWGGGVWGVRVRSVRRWWRLWGWTCVCTHVCVCVCVCLCARARVRACVRTCMCACMSASKHVCGHMRVGVGLQPPPPGTAAPSSPCRASNPPHPPPTPPPPPPPPHPPPGTAAPSSLHLRARVSRMRRARRAAWELEGGGARVEGGAMCVRVYACLQVARRGPGKREQAGAKTIQILSARSDHIRSDRGPCRAPGACSSR